MQVFNNVTTADMIRFIGNDRFKVPYMYINLLNHCRDDKNKAAWATKRKDVLTGIYYRYFDCLHFYTREYLTADLQTFSHIIAGQKPRVVMLPSKDKSTTVLPLMQNYKLNRHNIVDMHVDRAAKKDERAVEVGKEQLNEEADLMLADPIYHDVYNKESLVAQLTERLEQKFGRSYCIYFEGKIAALCDTYAESRDMAVVSGLLVHPECRKLGLGKAVLGHICHILAEEGKTGVSLIAEANIPSLKLYEAMGATTIGTLEKYIRKVP